MSGRIDYGRREKECKNCGFKTNEICTQTNLCHDCLDMLNWGITLYGK